MLSALLEPPQYRSFYNNTIILYFEIVCNTSSNFSSLYFTHIFSFVYFSPLLSSLHPSLRQLALTNLFSKQSDVVVITMLKPAVLFTEGYTVDRYKLEITLSRL